MLKYEYVGFNKGTDGSDFIVSGNPARLTVTKQELVADNVEAFGHLEAAKKLRKAGVPFSIAYWLIFGKAPKVLAMPPSKIAFNFYCALTDKLCLGK